jgi:hypothetical protein
LNGLTTPAYLAYVTRLLDLFVAHRGNPDIHPSLKLSLWNRLVPVVMNDNDAWLLSSVLTAARSRVPFRIDVSRVSFANNFQPLYFDLHLDFLQTQGNSHPIGRELFGVEPPVCPLVTDLPNHEALSRRWRSMKEIARSRGEPVVDLLWDNVSHLDSDFLLYAECQILEIYRQNFAAVGEKILIAEYLAKLKILMRTVSERSSGMVHCYSATFFKQIIDRQATLEQSIAPIYQMIDKSTSPGIVFDICCLALDCADFPVTREMEAAEHKFSGILGQWMEEVAINCVTFPFEARRKQVLDCSVMLQSILQLRPGRVLKILIEFQDRLEVIAGDRPFWEQLFFFAVAHAQCPQVLRHFLVFHHVVFQSDLIVGRWARNIHDRWQRFAAGMWHIVRVDRKFCEKCSDPKAVQKFFVRTRRGSKRGTD